jgi:hypothetical protein
MTIKRIIEGEMFPVFALDDDVSPGDKTIELSEDQLADYRRVVEEYFRWQKILETAS